MNNQTKWKAIATIGIWTGTALASIFSQDFSLMAFMATGIIWVW